jgi:pimeloyl-ACP methyl ester carboxylesterase
MPGFAATDGTLLHYEVSGTGEPVVLVHSLGFDGSLWQAVGVTDALIRAGRSVVALDLRGHGRSQRWHEPSRYGIDTMALDIVALVDQLGLQSVDLAAYSIGSLIALRYLQLDHRARRAVLGGIGGDALPQPAQAPRDRASAPTVDEAEAQVRSYLPHLADRVDTGHTDAQAVASLLRSQMRLTYSLDNISAKVLLVCGTQDDDPSPLAAALPDATIQLVDADHGNTMNHPAFAPAVVDFIA